jgi:hypothetical protein
LRSHQVTDLAKIFRIPNGIVSKPFRSSASFLAGWSSSFTGSDTSANALFGTLQVITAKSVGVSPALIAAANSSGGTLGKMIGLQTIAIAAGATGLSTLEQGAGEALSLYLTAQRDPSSSGRADCPCLHLCFSAYISSLANELALVLFDGETHELHGFKQVMSHGFLRRGGVTFLDGLVNRPMVPQNRRRNARQQEFELNAMSHKVSQHLQ